MNTKVTNRFLPARHTLLVLFMLLGSLAFSQIGFVDKIETQNHEITSITYSPTGDMYATAGYDQSIIIRDARGQIIKRLFGHKDFVKAMSFSADGQYLVAGGDKKTVFIWNVSSGSLSFSLKQHKKDIKSIAISKSNQIASASGDNTICLWDLKNGALLKTLEGHEKEVTSVDFNKEGTLLVSSSNDETIKLWDAQSGALLKTYTDTEKKAGAIHCARFSPNGKYIAEANSAGKVIIWSVKTGLKLNEVVSSSGEIISIEYSPDGRFLITGASNGRFQIWNLETKTSIFESKELSHAINALAISADGSSVLLGEFTSTLYVVDIKPLGIAEMLASMNEANQDKEPSKEQKKANVYVPKSPVDSNVPEKCKTKSKNKYALIIGNEDYSSNQMGLESEVNVDFAINDAVAFSNYAKSVFCIPDENIFLLKNAKAVEMHRAIEKISLLTEITGPDAEIVFYFAGHGFPDEVTKEPYIMPVDVSGNDLRFAISIKDLYVKLTENPHEKVTVFLDACFSGGARNQGLLAARGVKVVAKNDGFKGNLVVFSASSGQESSLPYREQYHGMFTFMLLKKLQETNGEISYGDLSDYLKVEVARKSIIINNKPQNPETNISPTVGADWRNWEF